MTMHPLTPASFHRSRRFDYVVLALLALDTLLFLLRGAPNDALDSAAWLVILLVFWFEIARGRANITAPQRRLVTGLYLCSSLAIALTTVNYWRDDDPLSFTNSLLWIALALLIEIELRRPRFAGAHVRIFMGVAGVLYAGLVLMILWWALEQDWFDVWDATLWFIEFLTIELDLIRRFRAQSL